MVREKRSRVPDLGRPEVTELEFRKTTHRVAEVEPLDVDGVRTMTVGTVAWGIIALALLPFWGNLQDQGRTWWLWTAIAGLGLGLMGIEFCKRRRDLAAERPVAASEIKTTAPKKTPERKTLEAPRPAEAPPRTDPVAPPVAEEPAPKVDPDRPVGRRRRTT